MRTILIICLLIGTQLHAQGDYLLASYQQSQSDVVTYDTDAEAFMVATGIPNDNTVYYASTPQEITGEGMWEAINTLVVDLKNNGTWDKYYAIYPFIGGTAATHKWNLKDPRDLNASYRLTFHGTWTHNAMGAKGDGVNGTYADTHLVDSEVFTMYDDKIDVGIGYYSNLTVSPSSVKTEVSNGGWNESGIFLQLHAVDGEWNGAWGGLYNDDNEFGVDGNGSDEQFIQLNANDGTVKYVRNGVLAATASNIQIEPTDFTEKSIVINAARWEDEFGDGWNSAKRTALVYVSEGLTDMDVLNDYTAFQKFQTKLNRHVGTPIY
jgi:hypothetical protein